MWPIFILVKQHPYKREIERRRDRERGGKRRDRGEKSKDRGTERDGEKNNMIKGKKEIKRYRHKNERDKRKIEN